MQTERIQWKPIISYNSYQNGVAKQYFYTLFMHTQAKLYDANLPNNQ